MHANSHVFFIPDFRDHAAAHWQRWLQARLPDTSCLGGLDVDHPDLDAWVEQGHRQLNEVPGPVWLVAHGFGCFVAAVLAAERPAQLGGILFVAPANPSRFASRGGVRDSRFDRSPQRAPSVADVLPLGLPLAVRSALLASENDPWCALPRAQALAEQWRSHFVNLGHAGHMNADSGHGPWPGLLRQLGRLRRQHVPDFSSLQHEALERGALAPDPTRSFRFDGERTALPLAFRFAL